MFPASDFRFFTHHLGVAYIQAYLAKNGFTSKQVLPTNGSTLNDCAKELLSTNAKIIGFTCYDKNFYLVSKIASIIKSKRPKTIVIAGGPAATFSDKMILNNTPSIDLCVRFEGEKTALDLASCIYENSYPERLADISGITFRHGKSIITTPDRPLFGSENNKEYALDGLPSPYLSGTLNGTEGAGVLSARGCTNRCTYCNFSAMSKHTIRYHSIDRIISELKYIKAAVESNHSKRIKNRIVPILDDSFTTNVRRAKDICKHIIDEEIKLELSCLIRAENIDEELIALLSQAGFVEVCFGVESAVPRILRNVKRISKSWHQEKKEDYSAEEHFLSKVKEGISLAKRHNIKTCVSFILGLPGETLEEGLTTIDFVQNLGADQCAQNYLGIYRGTELFDTANDYGIRLKASPFSLEYETLYAYPIHKIPICINSSLQKDISQAAKIILSAFTSGPDVHEGERNGISLALIERPTDGNILRTFKWLSKYLAVAGRIIILGKKDDTIDDYNHIIEDCSRAGLPTNEIYHLKAYSISDSEAAYSVINTPLNGRLVHWWPTFALVKLSNCLEFSKKHYPMQGQIRPIYCINENVDMYFLAAMVDTMRKDARCQSKESKLWLNGVFLDGCRWCKSSCPALRLRRIFINEFGDVFPCLTGKPLGTINESIINHNNNAKKIYAMISKNRECENCCVKIGCSKCLFTGAFSEQEYCELQQAKLDMSEIIANSKIANAIDTIASKDC